VFKPRNNNNNNNNNCERQQFEYGTEV